MTSLYDLAGQYKALALKLEALNLTEATVADTIESTGLFDSIEQKAAGCEMVARQFEAFLPAIEAEIDRLQSLYKSRAHKANSLREYIKTQMEVMGVEKIECPLFRITIVKNPPAVEVYEPRLIPAEFMRQPEPPPAAPDKKSIAAALKAGHEVQGARLTQSTKLKVI